MSWRLLLLAALVCCASACELDPKAQGGPVKTCTSAGQQCVYAQGKLGVCQFDQSRMLTCTSQH